MVDDDSPPFGIHRSLTPDSARKISRAVRLLQSEPGVPSRAKLEVCSGLAVVLLAEETIARTAEQGMRVGYRLGAARVRLQRNRGCQQRNEELPITLGQLRLSRTGVCYATPPDAEVENEVDAIETAVGIAKYGAAPRPKGRSARLDLFEVQTGEDEPLRYQEQQQLLSTAKRILPGDLMTQGWESTPFDIFKCPVDQQ